MAITALLTAADLLNVTSQAVIDRYGCDDGSGTASSTILNQAIANASSWVVGKSLRGWTMDQITTLMADELAKMQLAWVVLHFLARRRPEWRDDQGRAPFAQEYAEAAKYFDGLGKGLERSPQELHGAGAHPAIGGKVIMPQGQMATYVFAPDPNRGNPGGSGGY
jgi:hypothetical protein